ncbi:MAG: cytidylate kinase-like family protein [Agathobacter sp.]|nr:cytidylate kinase-like family protein [Agathobacter sp.]
MKYDYVVIEREYGSGGTEIGKMLAEKTGIPCYGSEILEGVSERLQIPVSDIQKYEETTTNSFLYSLYAIGKMNEGAEHLLSKENEIFLEEQKLIKEYALHGPAVFVGRCAVIALESHKVLKIFVHADDESRKQRAVKEYGIPENMADSTMAKYDKKRRNYYSANTGKKWNDWRNYDIILDSGKLGTEACAQIIQAALIDNPFSGR